MAEHIPRDPHNHTLHFLQDIEDGNLKGQAVGLIVSSLKASKGPEQAL